MEARHAGHAHSTAHAHVGLIFLGVCIATLVLYSASAVIYGKLRPSKPLSYPVPSGAVVAVWIAFIVGGFIRSRDWDSLAWWARRCGRLGLAAAVFSQFLVLKPAPLPRTYVVSLTFCHKWTGRSAVLLALWHGFLYGISYYRASKFTLLFTEKANLWGVFALCAWLVMAALALRFVRRRWYFLFYIPHIPLSWFAMVLVIFHARPSAAHIVEVSSAIGALGVLLRIVTSRSTTATVHSLSGYDIVELDRQALSTSFPAGSHLRLSSQLVKPTGWMLPAHPYTVASLDSDNTIKLVVRRTRWQIPPIVSCQGPFHCPFDVFSYSKILAVGGGAGVSFLAPLWRRTVNTATNVKAVWVTQNVEDLQVLGHIGLEECEAYITGNTAAASDAAASSGADDADAFELDTVENDQLLPKNAEVSSNVQTHSGRPQLDDFLAFCQDADVAVVACGPDALVRDLRAWAKHYKFDFFAEEYAT